MYLNSIHYRQVFFVITMTSHWGQGVSNHWQLDFLLNKLTTNKSFKLRITSHFREESTDDRSKSLIKRQQCGANQKHFISSSCLCVFPHRPVVIAWERDVNGMTLLHLAAFGGYLDVACWLLDTFGKSLAQVKNNRGQTPIHLAAARGNREDKPFGSSWNYYLRHHSGYALSQCETTLQCNVVSH